MPFLQATADGVVVGCIVALAALGLAMVWGIERFANASQGDTLTVAAYFAMSFHVALGLPILLAAFASVASTAVTVMFFYYLVFRPLSQAPRLAVLLTSIGVALTMRSLISIVWGTRLQSYRLPLERDYQLGPILISPIAVLIIMTTLSLVACTYWIIFRTRTGREMRAVSDLPDLARIAGISAAHVKRQVWLINAVVTALAGILFGAQVGITPLLGWNLLLAAFAAAVLGGIRNPLGVVAGGLVLGLAMQWSTLVMSSVYREAVAFVVLAVVLILRPRGLVGGRADG